MSLLKQSTMTEKSLAAHRGNARKSRGAVTAEGKERARAANLRHGYYSKLAEEALPALGEDPAELEALIASAYEQCRPANAFQARVVERMARVWWRMERAERIQDSLAVQQLERRRQHQQRVAVELRQRYALLEDALETLQEALASPNYHTRRGFFGLLATAYGGEWTEAQEEIFVLLHRLRKPPGKQAGTRGTGLEVALRAAGEGSQPDEQPSETAGENPWEASDAELDEIYEQGDWADEPIPRPDIPVATGAARAALRLELQELVKSEYEAARAAYLPEIAKYEQPLSRYARDQLLVPSGRHARLMQRQEESCFRQIWRLGNFLSKLQAQSELQEQAQRQTQAELQDQAELKAQSEPRARRKNAGESGDLDENTYGGDSPAAAAGPAATPGAPISAAAKPAASARGGLVVSAVSHKSDRLASSHRTG